MTRDQSDAAIVLDALRRFRLNSDLSDQRISHLMGVETATFRTWVAGTVNPQKQSLNKICSFLKWHGRKGRKRPGESHNLRERTSCGNPKAQNRMQGRYRPKSEVAARWVCRCGLSLGIWQRFFRRASSVKRVRTGETPGLRRRMERRQVSRGDLRGRSSDRSRPFLRWFRCFGLLQCF